MDALAREKTIKTTLCEFFSKSSFTCESKRVCVIMRRLDLLLQPLVTCKWTKIRKDKIIIFYSFPNFTFTFLPKRSFMYFLLLPKVFIYFDFHLWSKSLLDTGRGVNQCEASFKTFLSLSQSTINSSYDYSANLLIIS